MRIPILIVTLIFLITTSSSAATLRLSEGASGQYRLEAIDLPEVAALDILISYDSTSLRVSSISRGQLLEGMLFAGNPGQPGKVRIGAVGTQPISGSGILVNISGQRSADQVVFTGLSAKLSDLSGRPVTIHIDYPNAPAVTSPAERTMAGATDPAATTETNRRYLIGNTGEHVNSDPAVLQTEPTPSNELSAYTPTLQSQKTTDREKGRRTEQKTRQEVAAVPEKPQLNFPAVQTRFQHYSGKRTLESMQQLFDRQALGVRQRPTMLLSDGLSEVEIEFPARASENHNVVVQNAQLVSVKSVSEGRTLVRCIPNKGSIEAKVFFLGNDTLVEVPLSVAPVISTHDIEMQPDKLLPYVDLDGDSKSSWRDDYILVANLIASTQNIREDHSNQQTAKP